MSNFSNLFQTNTASSYEDYRDGILEQVENPNLKNNQPGAGIYEYNGAAYTIGYGYDISQHTGQQIIDDFFDAGIFTDPNTDSGGSYANLYNALVAYNAGTGILSNVDTEFNNAFGTSGLTQAQAEDLLDVAASIAETSVATEVANTGAQLGGYTLGNNGLHELLVSEDYNGGSIFGGTQGNDIAADNVTDFLKDVLFFNNTSGGVYNQGVENRRIQDLAANIGLPTPLTFQSGGTVVYGLDFSKTNNVYVPLDIARAIAQNNSAIDSHIVSLSSAGNLTTLKDSLLAEAETALQSFGYYVIQPGDTASSIADQFGISTGTLSNINAAFSDSASLSGTLSAGGLVHVPVGIPESVSDFGTTQLATLLNGTTYVYDQADGLIYTVGSSLDGHDAGALIIDASDGLTGFPSFASGTFSGITLNPTTESPQVILTGTTGFVLGTYDLDPSLTLPDGTVIDLTPPSGVDLTNTLGSSATPEQVIVDYLGQFGDTLTTEDLEQLDYDYQNPSGTAYTVTGSVEATDANTAANVTYTPDGSGAIIAGEDTAVITYNDPITGLPVNATVPATNILQVSGTQDLAADDISNIQILQGSGPDDIAKLTLDQFGDLSEIDNAGVVAETAGTYDLTDKTSSTAITLTAASLGGTTLIGNDSDLQTLAASTLGNDTLVAGNGIDDTLYTGGGNDTLTGGSGGDTFVVNGQSGLDALTGGSGDDTFQINGIMAAGSSIDGGGGNDTLEISENIDLTPLSISNMETLDIGFSIVSMTATQFAAFDTMIGVDGLGTIDGVTGGTYDLSGKGTSSVSLAALSSDGTTLIGNDADDEVLSTSQLGNDTLIAGNGNNDGLFFGSGVDTLIGGSGDDFFSVLNFSSSTIPANGTSIEGGAGSNTLFVNGQDISGMTISDVQTLQMASGASMTADQFGNFDTISTITTIDGVPYGQVTGTTGGTYDLTDKTADRIDLIAESSDGTVLIGNDADNEQLFGSISGNDTLQAGDGDGDYLYGGSGTNTFIGGSGSDTFVLSNSSTDTIDATDGIINLASSNTVTVNGDGNTINMSSSDTVTINGTDTAVSTIGANSYAVTLEDTTVTSDGLGNVSFTTPLGGFGSSYLTLNDDGSASFSVGSDNITIDSGSLISASYADGAFTFDLNSSAPGYSESVSWNPTTGKAILNITDAENSTFSSSLGYINPGDTLEISSSISTLYDSSPQALNATQVNADGSQNDITYNTTGSGDWLENIYSYDAAGNLLSIGWDNDDGSTYTSFYDTNSTLQANESVNADGSGYVATANDQTLDFDGANAISGLTVNTSGDVTVGFLTGSDAAETIDMTASGINVTVGGNTLGDALADTNLSIDAAGNVTETAPLGGFGSSTITIGVDGTDSFAVGSDSISLDATSVTSLSYDGSAFNFDLSSVASGYSESVSWNPTTGKAILNITDAENSTFSSSLGYINPGDTLRVSGSLSALYDSGDQELNATQVNADGSQNDISYNTSGSGSWTDNIYSYDAAGNLTSIRWDNNDGSYADDFYDNFGGQTGSIIYNADDILHIQTADASSLDVSGIDTLDVTSSASLTAAQLSGFSNLTNSTGSADILYATTAGSYSLATQSITGVFNLDASQTSADVTFIGGSSATAYQFGSSFGQDIALQNTLLCTNTSEAVGFCSSCIEP